MRPSYLKYQALFYNQETKKFQPYGKYYTLKQLAKENDMKLSSVTKIFHEKDEELCKFMKIIELEDERKDKVEELNYKVYKKEDDKWVSQGKFKNIYQIFKVFGLSYYNIEKIIKKENDKFKIIKL